MKALYVSSIALLATAACAFASPNPPPVMRAATGLRLADYTTWFDASLTKMFKAASDANYYGTPCPPFGTPAAYDDTPAGGIWSGWVNSYTVPLPSSYLPQNVSLKHPSLVEVVFLGETAGWRNDFGVTTWTSSSPRVSSNLATSIQAKTPWNNITFGYYSEFWLPKGVGTEFADFFLKTQDGGLYNVFQQGDNKPSGVSSEMYWGTLAPGANSHSRYHVDLENMGYDPDYDLLWEIPWIVIGFEDQISNPNDYNDFVFAFRYGMDLPLGSAPEPSSYGILAAVGIAVIVAQRRWFSR